MSQPAMDGKERLSPHTGNHLFKLLSILATHSTVYGFQIALALYSQASRVISTG